MEENKRIFVILGPTATGKSDLAVWLSKKINGEVVCADSMQVYKQMDIATAKLTKKEMQNVKHHMIDILDVSKNFSVAEYVSMAKKIINDIIKRNKVPILVGGTGLYINSLLLNYNFRKNTTDEKLKIKLEEELKIKGKEYMFQKLQKLDKAYAKTIHVNNIKKILRGLESFYLTKKTMDENIKLNNQNLKEYDYLKIGLNFKDRKNLYERINNRVDLMLKKGVLNEAKMILSKKISTTAKQAIGYKEFKEYLENKITIEESILKLKQNSRRYAKRQMTWFNKDKEIYWFFLDLESSYEIKQKVLSLFQNFFK